MRNLRTFSGVAGFVTLVVNLFLLVDVHFDEDGLDVEKEEEDPKILEPNPIPTPCLAFCLDFLPTRAIGEDNEDPPPQLEFDDEEHVEDVSE